jgi:hypothetical protein
VGALSVLHAKRRDAEEAAAAAAAAAAGAHVRAPAAWLAPDVFSRRCEKFWVHPDDLLRVQARAHFDYSPFRRPFSATQPPASPLLLISSLSLSLPQLTFHHPRTF